MKKYLKDNKTNTITIFVGVLLTGSLIGILFFKNTIFNIKNVKVTEAIINGTEYPESAYPNVARLFSKNGYSICTGTLIDANHVITAAHCFYDESGARKVLAGDMTVRLNGKTYQSKSVYIHPTYKGAYEDVWGSNVVDTTIIELDKNVTDVTPAALLTTQFPLKTDLIIAGYGLIGCLPGSRRTPSLGKIYAGTTEFDGFGWSSNNQDLNSNYVYLTFDSCDANTASGDSGGPGFYDKKLASITSGGTSNFSTVGANSLSLRIDKVVPWINDVLSGRIEPTPDPEKEKIVIQFPFVYNHDEYLKFKFTNSVTVGNIVEHKIFIDSVENGSWKKDDGRYDLQVFTGLLGSNDAMEYYDKNLKSAITTLYKKSGTNNYLGQLETVKIKGPFSDEKLGDDYKAAIAMGYVGDYYSSNRSSGPVDPGHYTLTVFINNQAVISNNICLPSFTSATGKQIGEVVCSQQSQNHNDPKSLDNSFPQISTAIAPDGTTITFRLDEGNADIQDDGETSVATVTIKGHIIYDKTIDFDSKTGNILGEVYDADSKKVATGNLDIDAVTSTDMEFSGTFSALDGNMSPFTIQIKDRDSEVSSNKFSLDQSVTISQINMGGGLADDPDAEDDGEGTPPPSENAKRTYLFNPLREGLDSIPKIVSALVKDIVIPIALPALALAIIWTGFLFVMARGNETKLTEAKRALKWTVIGGLIILGAYVIATALQQTLKDIVQ
jgi:secreted trypsin-like serine protease/major membrane immunogen (membrane-anchored lipoprotein)